MCSYSDEIMPYGVRGAYDQAAQDGCPQAASVHPVFHQRLLHLNPTPMTDLPSW